MIENPKRPTVNFTSIVSKNIDKVPNIRKSSDII